MRKKDVNKFIVKFENQEALDQLAEQGEITYQSPILNIVFISTTQSKDALLQIDGIIRVNTERKGSLCV